jgi:hypothetical protein
MKGSLGMQRAEALTAWLLIAMHRMVNALEALVKDLAGHSTHLKATDSIQAVPMHLSW